MEPERRSIDQLNTEWRALGRGRDARWALERLSAIEPEVADLGAMDLADLVRALHRHANPSQRRLAARLFQLMLRSQSAHPLIARALLQALIPGLVTVARRLSWGAGGEWDGGGAFFSDLLAISWEVLVAWSGEDRAYAAMDVLSAVRCRARRQLLSAKAAEQVVTGLDELRVADRASSSGTDLDVLARALDDLWGNGLTNAEAAIVYGRHVLGYSVAELARMTGRTRRHIEARSRHAERQLCA